MGTINVSIDASAKNKKVAFSFSWHGDHEEIQRSMDHINETAERVGFTAQQLAKSTLIHLPKTGIMQEESAQQMQMMAIVYAVLDFAAKQNAAPGPILDVVADQDITATIRVRDNTAEIEIEGRPGPHTENGCRALKRWERHDDH